MNFKDFKLRPELLSAIQKLGFQTPTPVQEQAIPFLLQNKQDLVCLAQTGTGKTAAFSLPILQQIDVSHQNVQALILCPTRELCLQISKDIAAYSTDLPQLRSLAVYGGAAISNQKRSLKKGCQVVVGTPGRTLDLIRQKHLDVSKIEWLILDEADEMLNMGFKDDLEAILSKTPNDKQILLFSATMPTAMSRIVDNFMKRPHKIQVARQNIGASNIEHHFYITKAKDRYKVLQRLVDAHPDIYAIIFCRTRRETQQIADQLMQSGYNADTIHGDLSQNQRDSVMSNFKNKALQLLVATDVAARGIDVDELTHVINYQLPDDPEVYVHRSGRTGRAGNHGISISLINTREGRRLAEIEKMTGKDFQKKEIPSGEEICRNQIQHFLNQIQSFQPDKNILHQYWPMIEKEIGHLSSDEIINRLMALEIHRFLNSYENAEDLNVSGKVSRTAKEGTERNRGGKRSKNENWVGYTLHAGSKDRMKPKRLLALINEQTDSNDINIGDILIKTKTTYFEVPAQEAKRIEEAFAGLEYMGKQALKRAERRPEPTQTSRRGSRNEEPRSKKRRNGRKRR